MTTYLTRVIHFSAAHRYYRPEWSEERNRQAFGACANPHGHGHNYTLEVTIVGEPDPETGFCVDLPELDRVLDEQVVRRLDHQHVNFAIPEFAPGGLVPSTENLVMWIWRKLAQALGGVRLAKLRLREEPGLFVDYFGDDRDPNQDRRSPPDEASVSPIS